jgi:hypothetical protein
MPLAPPEEQTPTTTAKASLLNKMDHPNEYHNIEEEPSKDLSLAEMLQDEFHKEEAVADDNAAAAAAKKNNNNNNKTEDDNDASSSSSFRDTEFTMEQMNTSYGHQSWLRECYDSLNRFRYNCGMFVNNSYIQTFIILLISVNAIMMGLATFNFIKNNPQLNQAFETTDFVFLVIFTVELGFQFVYHGFRLLLDGWLVFDLIIIVTSWSFATVQIIRAFRIFRALRLVTRIKIMKNLILGK